MDDVLAALPKRGAGVRRALDALRPLERLVRRLLGAPIVRCCRRARARRGSSAGRGNPASSALMVPDDAALRGGSGGAGGGEGRGVRFARGERKDDVEGLSAELGQRRRRSRHL